MLLLKAYETERARNRADEGYGTALPAHASHGRPEPVCPLSRGVPSRIPLRSRGFLVDSQGARGDYMFHGLLARRTSRGSLWDAPHGEGFCINVEKTKRRHKG